MAALALSLGAHAVVLLALLWRIAPLPAQSPTPTIEVVLTEYAVAMPDDTHATVSFTQGYRSDAYRDEVQKTLSLVKQDGRWLIADEQLGRLVQSDKAIGNAEESVQAAVNQWAEAWAARDVEEYLASYA